MVMAVEYTKYERVRILSARALQISMGAPPLIKTKAVNPIEIAREEFLKDAIPITIERD